MATTSTIETRRRTTAAGRVADDLRERIVAGAYRPGSLFPGRRALGRQYDCGPLTIEAAVKALVAEGLLRTEDRRGTFVSDTVPSAAAPVVTTGAVPHRRHSPLQRGAMVGVVTPILIGSPDRIQSWHGAHAIVTSFERYISEFDGSTQIFGHNDERAHIVGQLEATDAAIEAGCDAILVAMHFDRPLAETLTGKAQTAGIPIVFIGSETLGQPALCVSYDNPGAGYQAADHLALGGARSITFVAHVNDWWVGARARGARTALARPDRAGISFTMFPSDIPLIDATEALRSRQLYVDHDVAGYELGRQMLASGMVLDGVIAANDRCAYGFMRATDEAGIVAGRDYSIVGFDDEPTAKFKQLSTMAPPWEAMGREAGRLLVTALNHPDEALSQVSLPSVLVSRMSTRKVALRD
ncbi:MAG TPA: GntR family transcriptional regulator [Capsulimonadaceae bacterium]